MIDTDAVIAELAGLRTMFLADLGGMMDAVDSAFATALDDKRPQTLEVLIRQVHSLAGTSETFGIGTVGQAARHAEGLLDSDGLRHPARIRRALKALRRITDLAQAA